MRQLTFFVKLALGAVVLSGGIILLILKSCILEYVADSVLILKPDSPIKNLWLKSPDLVPTDVYFFNWTNPEDFYNLSTKPKLVQCGPYRYMQHMEKKNVVWNNNNNTVTYNEIRYWNFDAEHKNGNLSDVITTLNAMTASLVHIVRNWNYFIRSGVSTFLSAGAYKTYFTKTAGQFLEGFDDALLDLSRLFPFIATDIPRLDRFGLISLKNASETFDGTFNIANGHNGNFDLLNWNYNNVTSYFNGACAKVHGSTGELYTRAVTKDYIDVFLPDICRAIRLDFEEEVVIYGIAGYKYSVGRSALDNGSLVQGNECYCAGDCIPSGLINISSCRYGLPYYASLPHFYGADPVYLDAVEGLHPEKEKHEAYVIIEQKTKILLKAVARFQMNILAQSIEGIRLYEGVKKIYFPMAWGQQTAVLPRPQRVFLKIFLVSEDIMIGISLLLICLGLYITVFVTFKPEIIRLYKRIRKCKSNTPQTIQPEEEPLKQQEEKKNVPEVVVVEKQYT